LEIAPQDVCTVDRSSVSTIRWGDVKIDLPFGKMHPEEYTLYSRNGINTHVHHSDNRRRFHG
jgi:hypothetical protein